MTDISVDLETLATTPDAHILSIGMVQFDRSTGEIGAKLHIVVDGDQPGRRIDVNTVRWWMQQDRYARAAVFAPEESMDLDSALSSVSLFVESIYPERVWGNGSHFDIAILEHAYAVVGKVVPWHYRAPRDLRTIKELAELRHGFVVGADIKFSGDPHNALDDAVHQAKIISDSYELIK